jgi:putative chitinase
MLEIAPHFSGEVAARQGKIIDAVGGVLKATLEEYGIASRLRIAHFLGQTCYESGGFRTTEEFVSGQQYEGRFDLGNTQPGDGPRYKGRGLIFLTGRANYRRMGQLLNFPLELNPEIAADPIFSLRIACEFWRSNNINAACDRDDLLAVTKLVNGGHHGVNPVREYILKAKSALARLEGLRVAEAQPNATLPILYRGSDDTTVVRLQEALRLLNYDVGIDGQFGPATEVAVTHLQRDHGLQPDGIVGEVTWKVLEGGLTTSHADAPSAEDVDAGLAPSNERRINAWIEDGEPPLEVGHIYKLGIDVGLERDDALASAKLEVAPREDGLRLVIVVGGAGILVEPRQREINVPAEGNAQPVFFKLTPTRSSDVLLQISVYLARELALLQEFEVPIEMHTEAKAA